MIKIVRKTGKSCVISLYLTGMLMFLAACNATVEPTKEIEQDVMTVEQETAEDVVSTMMQVFVEETSSVEVEASTSVPVDVEIEETIEESNENASSSTAPLQPVGHRIIYADGEIYGWTRYEYDETGRKDMVVFMAPNGNEYWSPVFYDGNGHVIPETVGTYSVMDENNLHLEVGTEDKRGRRTPMVAYAYDDKGNLTDYWYMYVSGKYLRHVVYSYDSHDHLIREELYVSAKERLESYVEYIYNGHCQMIRKNEVEDVRHPGNITYTLYQYDENGYLIREEKIWGGRTHDYVDYYYNEEGVLLREYHFLEDKMMGGPYTVEYLFEAINDSAG